ncbi:MAG: hypothetical protein QM715_02175 [Nibricoccus sp.]
MFTYRTYRFFAGLVLLGGLWAVASYLEVRDQVENSPYWPTDPAVARKYKVHVADAVVDSREIAIAGANLQLTAIWKEHSYSYRRTGLFTSTLVMNQEEALRILFSGTQLIKLQNAAWRIELDGKPAEAALTTHGAVLGQDGPFQRQSHTLTIIAPSGLRADKSFHFPSH